MTLAVTNQGAETLPFGTGWHPYFPLSPQTRIQAQASGYWLEREQWLAGEFCEQLPQELDFNQLAPLPRQWVNNGFAGWNGKARIEQPQEGYAIIMETTPPAPCYFIFVSDPAFDKGYAFDFFCLEPMSHAPDDHHRPEGGDLIALAPGESDVYKRQVKQAAIMVWHGWRRVMVTLTLVWIFANKVFAPAQPIRKCFACITCYWC